MIHDGSRRDTNMAHHRLGGEACFVGLFTMHIERRNDLSSSSSLGDWSPRSVLVLDSASVNMFT